MTDTLTYEQLQADVAFLLMRADCAGSCNFTSDRWTGMSSNALVSVAYGGDQPDLPWDRGDYAACVRTFVRLPQHRRTPEVRAALAAAREHYLNHYPEDRFPGPRKAAREKWAAEAEAYRKKHRRRRR